MTQLRELLLAVKEQNIPKTRLEELYTDFLNLFSETELTIAEIEKRQALFLEANEEKTEAAKKRKWDVTEDGQNLIVLKRQSKVLEKQLSAVKHRIFSIM